MEKHFFVSGVTTENKLRKVIFDLMRSFERMHDAVDDLLAFEITEKMAKDTIEACLIHMQKLNREMDGHIREIEGRNSSDEKALFEKTRLYEAMRRTYNFLTPLNYLDLDKDNWVMIAARCLIDKTYYRQIKALVFIP